MKIIYKLVFYIFTEFSISVNAHISVRSTGKWLTTSKAKYSNNHEELNNSTGNQTYFDARRNNPSYSKSGNINDPDFQRLLDRYRGMVQRYKRPENQEVNVNYQPALLGRNIKGYDISKRAWVTTQVPKAGRNGESHYVLPKKYGDKLHIPEQYKFRLTTTRPVLRGPPNFDGPANSQGRPGGQNPGGQHPGGHNPGGHNPGGQNPGVQYPGGQHPGGQNSGGQTPMDLEAYSRNPEAFNNTFPDGFTGDPESMTMPGHDKAAEAASRFTTRITTSKRRRRTTPPRVSFEEDCDYIAYYCLKAYDTGQICGRTVYHIYSTFENYCMMDFVNCMERYDLWQIVHMGECFELKVLSEYLHYPYKDDYFLDQYYIVEDM